MGSLKKLILFGDKSNNNRSFFIFHNLANVLRRSGLLDDFNCGLFAQTLNPLLIFLISIFLEQDSLTGNFRMRHTTTEVLGAPTAASISSLIAEDENLQWQVFVPETYSPGKPPGIFVFVDPNGYGGMPDQYRQLFTNRNLIWIGASSNERNPGASKLRLQAIMAQRLIDQNYRVNLNRVYVGSSGDAALIAVNVLLGASEFGGALYINGSVYWDGGRPENLDDLTRKRHVFIVGMGDKRWPTIQRHYEDYKKDGIENVKLLFRPGTIYDWPESDQMDEALAYLDAR